MPRITVANNNIINAEPSKTQLSLLFLLIPPESYVNIPLLFSNPTTPPKRPAHHLNQLIYIVVWHEVDN